ncbi:hypothetical protein [Caballeronia sp. INDeC2]|uniref:hypothetical protein n=1 Tax=Caballeronia sp. INDeC2 TaxID=2921747 RepID=UPI002028407F|nr:hypothetical protein [Caballeronia sp. INDeC2]
MWEFEGEASWGAFLRFVTRRTYARALILSGEARVRCRPMHDAKLCAEPPMPRRACARLRPSTPSAREAGGMHGLEQIREPAILRYMSASPREKRRDGFRLRISHVPEADARLADDTGLHITANRRADAKLTYPLDVFVIWQPACVRRFLSHVDRRSPLCARTSRYRKWIGRASILRAARRRKAR